MEMHGSYPFHKACLERVQKEARIACYKFIGVMNGWKEAPQEYLNCNHAGESIPLNRKGTWSLHICHTCKITWNFDSSD
jgi:hypothetical protein